MSKIPRTVRFPNHLVGVLAGLLVGFGLSGTVVQADLSDASDVSDVSDASAPLSGFSATAAAQQRALEIEYDRHIAAEDMDKWLRQLARKPHHVGSQAGRELTQTVLGLFQAWGYDAAIEEYQVLLPTPRVRELSLLAPTQFEATLTEDSLPEDASTNERTELLPPYNAFSIDGDVEGELVFVNYGTPEDYEILERHGVSVKGKIAIAKYGRSWRGIKPKLAGEKGAIGTLIYSDPADDGYGAGDTYPNGPFKHASGVQRGSVMDMPTYPGDVLTPGKGATKNARRLPRSKATTITKIPVLPISWQDALPLLSAMGGAVVPPEWRGGLPITYHLGPGPARVKLRLAFDWNMVTARNVIAKLPGAKAPDEWVIRGNHHDGWNHGAADPLSGLVALLAEAKSVGMLAKAGKPPARTIVYAAWDAEEPGLIGSTEWAEHHAAELRKKAVAYLNTDGNSRGFAYIGGSHALETFFNEVMRDVPDPRMNMSVKERRQALAALEAKTDQEKSDVKNRKNLRIYPLGSGSDYTPFLQHLGIASANISFGGEGGGGSYHTLYDTYEHFTTWRDPGFAYGVALAQVAGRATLRLANAQRLPFDFTGLTDNIALYVDEVVKLTDDMRAETLRLNQQIDEGVFAAALDPTKSLGPPKRHAPVPHINFAPLHNALAKLQAAARGFAESIEATGDASAEVSAQVNNLLYTSERLLTRKQGLAGRTWYKHHLYAPGFYTGYGVKTLPGVREAIEQRQYADVPAQVTHVATILGDLAARLDALAELVALPP